MVEHLFEELKKLEQVEAIALGGSRSGKNFDEKSDYDVYVYINSPIDKEVRKELLGKYCCYMEIGNHYWEYEDNCTLNDGIDIDILYRHFDDFCTCVSEVVEKYEAHNGYTTCMWHNLIHSKVIFDPERKLEQAQNRFSVPYPEPLRTNIITRNCNLLYDAMPAYSHQIRKACERNDRVSILHRTAAFLESYFDVIFAINRTTHPGEKRLVALCKQKCPILPDRFEENLNQLFDDMSMHTEKIKGDIDAIIDELKKITND